MPQLEISTFSSQIFWLIVSFTLMLIMMRFLVVPRISSIIEQRNRYIENYLKKAEKLQEEALVSLEKYNTAIENAKKLAEEKSKEAEKELSDFVQQKSEAVEKQLNEKIEESERILSEQRNLALEEAVKAANTLDLLILKKIGLEDVSALKAKVIDDGRRDN